MFKLFLCILILFCGAVIGLHLSQRLTRRRDVLQSFDVMLHRAMTKIEYNAGSLYEVFSDNFADFPFHHNIPFVVQWERFVHTFAHVLPKEDIALLMDFSKDLGAADTESQHRHMMMYSQLLQERIDSAQEDIQNKSKMYRILPLSAGMVISLLVI